MQSIFVVEPGGIMPTRAHPEDVGYDLWITSQTDNVYGPTVLYDTHIKVEPPAGYYWEVFPRSSISKTGYMLANGIGLIDPNYRGTIKLALTKIWGEAPELELPCKIGQLVLRKIHETVCIESTSETLSKTTRNEGGFGSTDCMNRLHR